MIYYKTQLQPTLTADEEAVGYEINNAKTTEIEQQWRSTTTGQINIDLDLGSDQTVEAIMVQHTNVDSFDVHHGTEADGSAVNLDANTLDTAQDFADRYKGIWVPASSPVTARYITLDIDVSEAPNDAAAYFYVGAIYVMDEKVTLQKSPDYGASRSVVAPGNVRELANRRRVKQRVGKRFTRLTFETEDLTSGFTEDLEGVAIDAEAGCIVVDLSTAGIGQWPMRWTEPEVARQYVSFGEQIVALVLDEIV